MGSPFFPTLTNAFLCHFEQWLFDCPICYKPILYKKYVYDLFSLFSLKLHVTKLLRYMISKHRNTSFTAENEENNSLSFLDENTGELHTSVYSL